MKATPAVARARKAWYRRNREAVLLVERLRREGRVITMAEARRILAEKNNARNRPQE